MFLFLNIYAPNKTNEQCIFYDEIQNELDKLEIDTDCKLIVGGDLNVIREPDLDGSGGSPKLKESSKKIENLCLSLHLIDIWRIWRNPKKTFLLETENPNDSMVVRLLVDITQLDYELEISIA